MGVRIGEVIHQIQRYDGHSVHTVCFISVVGMSGRNGYEITNEDANCPKCLEAQQKWINEFKLKGLWKD